MLLTVHKPCVHIAYVQATLIRSQTERKGILV
jgi:hypothetical protein